MNPYPLRELGLNTFLSQYWQKQALLIPKALPNITSPLSADELAGLACEDYVESRLIINKENNWQLKHGPFTEETFTQLPNSHWTLLVQAVDHYISDAASLLEQFNFIPRWRIDDLMVSYASKGGGVGPHYDNYDVFLIQTQGQRLWQVGGHYDDTSPLKELPVKIVEDFCAEQSWVLNPGDMLYVPPGVGHNGIAQSDDCMTCSVGFRAPSHSDILRDFTDYLGEQLNESMRYSDTGLKPQVNSGEINNEVFSQLQSILSEQIQNPAKLQDWFGRYITTPKYESPSYFNTSEPHTTRNLHELKNHLSSNHSLYRNESSRFAFIKQNQQHILFVDGEKIPSNSNSNALIEKLCHQTNVREQDFTATDDNLNLILLLINKRALYIK